MALGRLLRSFADHKLTTRQRRLDCLDHSAKVGEFVVLSDRLVMPKLTGFIFAQIAQFPVMAACPLAAALLMHFWARACRALPLNTVGLMPRSKQFRMESQPQSATVRGPIPPQ